MPKTPSIDNSQDATLNRTVASPTMSATQATRSQDTELNRSVVAAPLPRATTSTVQAADDAALAAVTTGDTERIIKRPDNTIIVQTSKDVYVNTYEQVTEQKFITLGTSTGTGASGFSGFSGAGGTGASGFSGFSGATGIGTPGGLDGQVQYNDGGAFGGSPSFTYDSATSTVGLEKISNPGPITVEVTSTPAWYSLYGDLAADVDDDYSSSVVYDSLGNIYSVGADGNTGVPFLLKYSPSGTLLWQKTFTEVNNYYKTGDALTVDSLDNVYCSISVEDAVLESYIIKLDSSGNIIWQLKLQNFNGTDGDTMSPVTDMTVDGSDNLYAIAAPRKLITSWISDAVLIKFSSSGVLQWQRKLSTPSVDDSLYPQGIWVDSAGNSHIVMTYTITSPYLVHKCIVAKYTTGGSLVWQNEYDIDTSIQGHDSGYNITGDSVGNIYFTVDSVGNNIIKADSTGSIIWNKQIDSSTYSRGVALDASGNVYVSGQYDAGLPTPKNDYLILKYTSAGSLVWQRSFGGLDNDYAYYYWATRNIDVLGENYVIAGYTYTPSLAGNAEAIAVQLKTDGSGTGVYGSFTYGIPAFTESTPAITVQASTLTASVAGLTISAGGFTAADLTKTAVYTYMFGGAHTWLFNDDGSTQLPGYTLTATDGTCGQALTTDGAGNVSWSTISGGSLPATPTSLGTVFGYTTGFGNTAIGCCAGNTTQTGANNISIGYGSLKCNTDGGGNIAIGEAALYFNSSGVYNISAGNFSLYCNSGSRNIGLGAFTLRDNTTGEHNTAIGTVALCSNNGGSCNVAIGTQSLKINTNGTSNIGVGACAGSNITTGNNNTVIGSLPGAAGLVCTLLIGAGTCERIKVDNAGLCINGTLFSGASAATPTTLGTVFGYTTNSGNIAVGCRSGNTTSPGCNNVALGYGSLVCNTYGCDNIGLSYNALNSNTTGSNNIAIGKCSLFANQGGNNNTALSEFSLYANRCGSNNIAIGKFTLLASTSGCNNIAQGYNALCRNCIGNNNIAQGNAALRSNTDGCNNIAVGTCAGCNITTGTNNTVIGSLPAAAACVCTVLIGAGTCERIKVDNTGLYVNGSLIGGASPATPTSLGTVFGYTATDSNISVGYCSGNMTNTGLGNFSAGYGALVSTTSANNNVAIGTEALTTLLTGYNNIAVGYHALRNNVYGCNNVAQGYKALCSNTYGGSNIAIGEFTLASNTTGNNNIGIGYSALYGNTVGSNNTGLGFSSLSQNTTGVHNVAIGCYSLGFNTGGFQNIAIGRDAMCVNTTGYSNVAVGPFNLVNNTAGFGNVAVGYGSLCANTSGVYNIALGFRGLYCNTEGSSNISIGSQTLFQNTTGAVNIAIGASSLSNNRTGSCNIAIGYRALHCNLSGNYNIAQGYYAAFRNCGSCNIAHGFNALYGNTTGNLNIAIGVCAGCSIITGVNNTVIGSLPAAAACVCTLLIGAGTCERVKVDNTGLYINGACWCSGGGGGGVSPATPTSLGTVYAYTSTDSNISVGYCSGNTTQTGCGNVAIGLCALAANTTGIHNIAIGLGAQNGGNGDNNISLGHQSQLNNSNGYNNFSAGYLAMRGSYSYGINGGNNVAIGYFSMLSLTTGANNIALGCNSLRSIQSGSGNVALGPKALQSNLYGNHNTAVGYGSLFCNQGSNNIAIGYGSLCANISGSENIAIGAYALRLNESGSNNIAQGYQALYSTAGNNNLGLGFFAGSNNTSGSNNIFLGCNAQGATATSSNTITLGDANITCIRSQITSISTLSDARDKTAVETLPLGLAFINQLRPVKFTWNMRTGERQGMLDTGFIAQEVAEVEDNFSAREYLDMVGRENPQRLEIKPAKLIPILVRAVQELSEQNTLLRAELQDHKLRIAKLETTAP